MSCSISSGSLSHGNRERPGRFDAKARELRDTQRRHGLVAVREEILTLLGRYRQTKIAPHRIARMLDVPPERITRWLEAKDQFDAERAVTLDPRIRVARRLAEIEDQKAQCAEQLIKPSGQKSFAAIMGLQTRLRADEDRLLEAAGLNKTIFDQRDDGAKSVHDTLFAMFAPIPIAYEVLDEAGIDPDAPTPNNIAAGRAAYDEFRAEFPDTPIPDFMEDDPWGWRPSVQNDRLIKAHKLATGRKGQYGKMPGDLDPVPGVSYIPADVSEVAELIRQQKELAELDQDDPGDAFGEPGCIEPAEDALA